MTKKNWLVIALSLIVLTPVCSFGFQNKPIIDTNYVKKLDTIALTYKSNQPIKTVFFADSAYRVAQKLEYEYGMAEALRTKGIGYDYLKGKVTEAYECYSTALKIFKKLGNEEGVANVNNNIGNLYREDAYDKALIYFNEALKGALKIKSNALIAKVNLNMGNVYLRQKKYAQALTCYNTSQPIFEKTPGQEQNVINCLQNKGSAYYFMREFDKAEEFLLKAYTGAKKLELTDNQAAICLELAELNIAKNNFTEAEKYLKEGLEYARDTKKEHDYIYDAYWLEFKRKNYEKSVKILAGLYTADSTQYKNFIPDKLELIDRLTREKDLQVTIAQQKTTKYLFWGTGVATVLLIIVVALLVANVKRKNQSNLQLTELNAEVSRQKDNVDRINKHLEEIIDERTKDLQIKNKKLAEHSSYLSHQIRGPIATLKGLMNLEREGLVDQNECITMMNRCVSEIDDKIIDMSDMLHDPGRTE